MTPKTAAKRTKTSAKTKSANRTAPRRGTKARDRIVMVGNSRRVRPVREALDRLQVDTSCSPWVVGLTDSLQSTDVAVVLVPPLAGVRTWRAVRLLRHSPWGAHNGVFVVLHDEPADREVRLHYKAGATAVFEWPRDALLLADLVAHNLGLEQAQGKATRADVAMARTVRARLKLAASIPSGLRISCREGVVALSGTIEGLWQRSLIAEVVERIPGVRGVVADGLRVAPTGVADKQVHRAVEQVLRAVPHVDQGAITASVEGGFVTLTGSVARRRELEAIWRAVSDLRGVRGIDNLVVVSPAQQQGDAAVSRRLQRVIEAVFPEQQVTIKVFDGVAVIQGEVLELVARRQIEAIVANDLGVRQVINKLVVR